MLDEGLENAWARHQACGDELHAKLPELGFELWAQEGHRLPELGDLTYAAVLSFLTVTSCAISDGDEEEHE